MRFLICDNIFVLNVWNVTEVRIHKWEMWPCKAQNAYIDFCCTNDWNAMKCSFRIKSAHIVVPWVSFAAGLCVLTYTHTRPHFHRVCFLFTEKYLKKTRLRIAIFSSHTYTGCITIHRVFFTRFCVRYFFVCWLSPFTNFIYLPYHILCVYVCVFGVFLIKTSVNMPEQKWSEPTGKNKLQGVWVSVSKIRASAFLVCHCGFSSFVTRVFLPRYEYLL